MTSARAFYNCSGARVPVACEEEAPRTQEVQRFAEGLVRGFAEHRERIDETIRKVSHHWRLERMMRVELVAIIHHRAAAAKSPARQRQLPSQRELLVDTEGMRT